MAARFTLSARNPDDAQLVQAIAGADHDAFEALMRRHNGKLFRVARAILKDDAELDEVGANAPDEHSESPPSTTLRTEIRGVLERRIDELPVAFCAVFVLREVEGMTVQETAECLSIPAAIARSRLFRARALLREALARDMDGATVDVFGFAGERCDRVVAGVLTRLNRCERIKAGTKGMTWLKARILRVWKGS